MAFFWARLATGTRPALFEMPSNRCFGPATQRRADLRITIRKVLVMVPLMLSCNSTPKTQPSVGPAVVSFAGTKTAEFGVSTAGSWTATSDQPWLTLTPSEGKGNATITARVNREGLTPGNYSAAVQVKVDGQTQSIPVFMRFPLITGNIHARAGKRPKYVPSFVADHIKPDTLEVMLEPGGVAVSLQSQVKVDADPAPTDSQLRTAMDALAAEYNLSVKSQLGRVFVVGANGQALADLATKLQRDGRVESAAPVNVEKTMAVPNDPLYAQQWHYPLINLPAAWDRTTGSANIPIAIVDTGILVTHPDVQSRVVAGYDFSANTDAMTDADGHGTHCAGTVGAASNNAAGVAGVTWQNPLIPVRVLGNNGTGSGDDIVRGLLFAAGIPVQNSAGATITPTQTARVVNASLGANDPQCTGNPRPSPAQIEIVKRIEANGTILVFAAGNDGPCNVINEWGAIPGVISVTAVGPNGQRAPYSTAGSDAWIAAPGGLAGGAPNGVLSTYLNDGTHFVEGTSMAAPHVAGVIGLMLAVNPSLTPVDVRSILQRTAQPIAGADAMSSGAPTARGGMGYGLVDADAAVAAAQSWTAAQSNYRAQLVSQTRETIANVIVDAGGNFTLRAPAGSFRLRVGNDPDNDGVLGEGGDEFDEETIEVSDDDDTEFDAALVHLD